MIVLRRANFADRLVLAYVAVGGVLIVLLRHRVPGWPAFFALHLVLIALVVALAANAGRWRTAHAWYPLAMPLILFEEVAALNFLLVDGWRDHYLLAFEASLFSEPPTLWLGRFASPLLTEILSIGYFSYFLILVIVAGVFDRRADKAPFFGVMAASLLSYMVCYAVFISFPTEGPAHTLRHLHTVPLAGGPIHQLVAYIQSNAGVHGNAFPSAHAAGAVAALVFAWRYAQKLAAWLTLPVVLMSIGAVYLRYHYASDIFAGILIGAGCAAFVLSTQARPPMATKRTATD